MEKDGQVLSDPPPSPQRRQQQVLAGQGNLATNRSVLILYSFLDGHVKMCKLFGIKMFFVVITDI